MNLKRLKKNSIFYTARFIAAVMCFIFFSLSSQDASAQDFSSIDNDLALLENLINDTLSNTQEQQKLLEDLKQNLNESDALISSYENTITEQEKLLANLREQLNAMYETYRKQSALSARYEKNSKFWKTFTLIAIPVTAVISGGVVWAVVK
jgi:septal ring factor EnvC (AmiA/AmiB activator)